MLEFTLNLGPLPGSPHASMIFLDHIERQIRQQRVVLSDGREADLLLVKGGPLISGDYLLSPETGEIARIEAVAEEVLTAVSGPVTISSIGETWFLIAQAAYLLGGRHCAVEIGERWISFLSDKDNLELVKSLGLKVTREKKPFNPIYWGCGPCLSEFQLSDNKFKKVQN
ncbi:MAG: hypothetical protein LBF22_13445 [Deltaproteobacteria bacterium]|jgi:urease accessory protein|nr:hypothetical protein [Deltaproteobacteria bacterium]